MSSNIEITRICEYCSKAFIAKTTKTRYCSHRCNQKHYKVRVKQAKIEKSKRETLKKVIFPLEQIKSKEYLTAQETAVILNCSVRTVYKYVKTNKIKAVNLGHRMIRIKKSDIDNFFKYDS
jgi:excisionase family DNA binding protein